MTTPALPHGRSRYRHHGCRCEVCIESNRVYMRELRARKRGLAPVPSDTRKPLSELTEEQVVGDLPPGPCVLAVRAQVERLGVRESEPALCAAAESMAAILDNRLLVTTQPSAAGKLMQIVKELHRVAAPRQSRLAAVSAMSARKAMRVKSRPTDAS